MTKEIMLLSRDNGIFKVGINIIKPLACTKNSKMPTVLMHRKWRWLNHQKDYKHRKKENFL